MKKCTHYWVQDNKVILGKFFVCLNCGEKRLIDDMGFICIFDTKKSVWSKLK